jgi:hypothetical protein
MAARERLRGLRRNATCGCEKPSVAQFYCSRIVIYNGFRNSNVSAVRVNIQFF